jgi:hypothetical protein
MILVIVEIGFELLMTIIGLMDIYTDIAFATIVRKEGMNGLFGISIASIVLVSIPKIYAMVLVVMMMFTVREEDRRRKYAYRILIFNEYRM